MERSYIQLDDLPDEILLIILKKLHNCDVLYSLIGVNTRLDAIVNDATFTKNLTLISPVNKRFDTAVNDLISARSSVLITALNGLSVSLNDAVLDRLCLQILPRINDKIQWLNVESSSMERILRTTSYPNIHTLGLYDLEPETATDLFSKKSYLICQFADQISSLFINMKRRVHLSDFHDYENIFIFKRMCTMFKNLQYFNLNSSSDYEQLTFGIEPLMDFSSNLLELHVVIKSIIDCLCLLDGYFNQLHTLYVTISPLSVLNCPSVDNRKKLPSLKCFSLIHEEGLMMYDKIYVPLFQRMLNLETLSLSFVSPYGPLIDGDYLKNNIINHMKRLNKFTFNIRSVIRLDDPVNLPSKEDIQNTFQYFDNEIFSSVDYYPRLNLLYCHVYSYPYSWTFYNNITNSFPGGIFKYVREISLHDERPFEYEFFLQIAESFPHVEKLSLNNREPQHNDIHHGLIIKYPYLIKLDLIKAHENYVEQFLDNTKTCFLNNIYLRVCYDSLQKATHNFARDATRINCSKIIGLVANNKQKLLSKSKDYFPHAEIY